MNIYQELLMDHYRHPRNCGKLENPDFSSGDYSPSCGDSVTLQGTIADQIIKKVVFTGKGCVISQATASLLTEWCIEKSIGQIVDLTKEDIQKIVGMPLGIMRIKCALLPLIALQKGLLTYTMK